MRAIKYLNTTPSTCALYNKGVSEAVYTQDTLTKKIEKKAGRTQHANALCRKVKQSFRKNTQKE